MARRPTSSDSLASDVSVPTRAGRSTVRTRDWDDKRPGKPRFMSTQRERFCRLIAFQGMTQNEAYREAYNSEGSDQTVAVEASKLRNNPEIAQRIDRLINGVAEKDGLTLEKHLAKLAQLRDAAFEADEFAPAISAEAHRGKAAGLYVEKHAVANSSLEDLVTGSFNKNAAPKHEKGRSVKAPARSSKRKKR